MKAKGFIAVIPAMLLVASITGCSAVVNDEAAAPSASVSQAPNVASSALPEVDVTAQPNETGVETSTKIVAKDESADLLAFLIEEEKLAHDIYQELGAIWGSQVFSNILQSETGHQDQVLALLAARQIDDPRSTAIGVFDDPDLQKLYDQLLAKGKLSITDAFEVGVIVEERDIADITEMLAGTLDADVIATLERLRNASENHLRAFNRQL